MMISSRGRGLTGMRLATRRDRPLAGRRGRSDEKQIGCGCANGKRARLILDGVRIATVKRAPPVHGVRAVTRRPGFTELVLAR